MAYVTKHGKKRIKQRCKVSKKSAYKLAEKALKKGITHSETRGSLNRYLTSLYFKNQTANNIRIYNFKVFIFIGSVLITVLDLPAKYRKTVENILGSKNSEFLEVANG